MRARVLFPLPDRDFDPTEVAVPYDELTRRGIEVVFATETGEVPSCDPKMLSGVVFGQLGAEEEAKRIYRAMATTAAFCKPLAFGEVDAAALDGLHLAGGHAPGMRPYLESEGLRDIVRTVWSQRRPVSAICHGVIVLARTTEPESGRSLLFDRRTTCLPKYMERVAYYATAWKVGRYYRTYPEYVEDEVRRALAHPEQLLRGPVELFKKGTQTDDGPAFVVDDGFYVSARWPGDAYKLGRVFAEKIIARKEGRPSYSGRRSAEAPTTSGRG